MIGFRTVVWRAGTTRPLAFVFRDLGERMRLAENRMMCGPRNGAFWLVLVACLVGGMGLGGCSSRVTIKTLERRAIGLEELRQQMSRQAAVPAEAKLLLIDGRPPSRFATGSIPSAVNRSTADFPMNLPRDPRVNRYETIVVFGENPSDVAASALGQRLLNLKYKQTRWFESGLLDWRRAGLRLTEPAVVDDDGGGGS